MPGALLQPFPTLPGSQAQVWSYSPRYRRPRHFHTEPELNFVVHGSATFGVGERVEALRAGELIAFAPGQDHELISSSPDLVLFAVGMSAALAPDVLRAAGERAMLPWRARLSKGESRALADRCTDATGRAGVDQAVSELWQAALWASKSSAAAEVTLPRPLTRRALTSLGLEPDLDRSALARAARACPSELSRSVSRDLGVRLVEYRSRLRLLRFIEHVDAGASQTAAALDAGFGSYSQCYRVFVATLAATPRDFFHTDLRHQVADTFLPAPAERC